VNKTIIKFCGSIGKTPSDTNKILKGQAGPIQCHEGCFFKWHTRSVEGRESVDDDNRSGRRPPVMPAHVTSVVQYIRAMVEYVKCTLHGNKKKTTKYFASIIPEN
jgi:hypothetical protein